MAGPSKRVFWSRGSFGAKTGRTVEDDMRDLLACAQAYNQKAGDVLTFRLLKELSIAQIAVCYLCSRFCLGFGFLWCFSHDLLHRDMLADFHGGVLTGQLNRFFSCLINNA